MLYYTLHLTSTGRNTAGPPIAAKGGRPTGLLLLLLLLLLITTTIIIILTTIMLTICPQEYAQVTQDFCGTAGLTLLV